MKINIMSLQVDVIALFSVHYKEKKVAILVSGEIDVNISNVTINKTGDSEPGDNTSFYGTNSAIIAKDKANLVLKYMTTNTNANGVFSYGGSASTNNTSVIEGKNSVSIENVELIDTNNELNGKSTTYKNIFLYQSMSGDAATGKSSFTSTNSKITTNKGDTFYVTNTDAIITLKNNTIINNDETGNFLRIQADSWGNTGSNGGNVTLNLNDENISGNIIVDSISSLEMNLESTTYEGIINGDNINIIVDKNSSIKLTGDSYIKSINDYSNIDFNGYKLYVNGNSIN